MSIPFSFQVPVAHIGTDTDFGCKILNVEAYAKHIDDNPNDEKPGIIVGDIDRVWCGQEDLKPTLEAIGGVELIQQHANDHAKQLLNA